MMSNIVNIATSSGAVARAMYIRKSQLHPRSTHAGWIVLLLRFVGVGLACCFLCAPDVHDCSFVAIPRAWWCCYRR
eukprot:8688163-Pyramimonas_sp.AAC.1